MSDYSIWVLEYGAVPNAPKGITVHGAFNQGTVKLPYCYVVIKGRGHVAMVDVGYNDKDHGKAIADMYGVQNWQPPAVVLKEVGVTPEQVTEAFITHAHFDHMGNTDDFPRAVFYVQEREISKWVWSLSLDRKFRWLNSATDPGDIMRAVDLARQGRLVSVQGDRADVIPGVDLHEAFDTHTWGSMYVNVRNDGRAGGDDCWIFAGDLIYSYANLEGYDPQDPQYIPIGLATGSQTNVMLKIQEMIELAHGQVRRVIPIHDEALRELFPSRITGKGLRITELALARGETSRVQ
jgi:glyoxylase-like metal-dependent hydrolase (beta-lactamase superfamily II)